MKPQAGEHAGALSDGVGRSGAGLYEQFMASRRADSLKPLKRHPAIPRCSSVKINAESYYAKNPSSSFEFLTCD